MRINLNADAKIVAALLDVNGKSSSHTYTTAGEVRRVAQDAEERLASLSIPKALRSGGIFMAQSGSNLPSAYKYAATTTTITLERGSSGWFLIGVRRRDWWPRSTPRHVLQLTATQDAAAIERLRMQYVKPFVIEMISL